MVGITCAVYDEAIELIKLLTPEKVRSIHYFTGNIYGQDVSLFLTRPSFKKNKNNFLEWIDLYPISVLLHTGFCGALSNQYSVSDICRIDSVFSITNNQVFSLNHTFPKEVKRHSIVTVEKPLLSMEDREDPRLKPNHNLVDMESWHLCKLWSEKKRSMSQLKIVKIVGDVPGETQLMQSEIKMRAFFVKRGFINKTKIAISTGIPFFSLYTRKRMLQKTLKECIFREIAAIHDSSK